MDSWKIALYDIAKKIKQNSLGIEQSDNETRNEYNKRLNLNSTEADYEKRPSASFVEDVKLYCRNDEVFVIAIDEIENMQFRYKN